MARVAEHLVGRAAEVASLDRAVAELESGDPSVLAVLGEPGIGKTRLLAELADRADARQHVVLSGSASELELDLPFWVFVDALDEYVAGLDPRRLASLEAEVGAELARVLPSLSDLAGAGPAALQDERYRAHRAVRELLERLAGPRPLVLVLDDVHWADTASIELLGALLRRPAAGVLLALAARPRQLPSRLAAALERAGRAGALTRLELSGLERDEASLLLGEGVDEGLLDSFYQESGGNPFYLEQLARAPRRPAALDTGAADLSLAGAEVPPAVVSALTEELELLSKATRAFLEGAAVAGDPFEFELAAAAASAEEPAAAEALDELLTLELVRGTEVPRRFRFRHPLVRRAVYESAAGGWLLGAHERCADALARRGASATVRAHHVEHAARHGDLEALAVMREAGAAATLRAPASAARWFGAALRLLPENSPPQERGELLMARAGALAAAGQLEESHRDLLETMALVPGELVDVRVRLTVACAGVEHLLGHHEEAHVRLTDALADLSDPAAPAAAALMIELTIDSLFRTEYDSMRRYAERAVEAARPLEDRPLTATAVAALTLACAFTGATVEAEAHRAEAASLVSAMSDEEIARRIDSAAHLAAAEIYLDRYREAGAHAERALAIGRATGQLFPTLIPTLGTAHFMLGLLADAAQVLDGGLEAARLGGNAQAMAWSLFNRSMAALYAGEVDSALDMAQEAVDLARPLEESFVTAWAGVALAAAALASGDPERAIGALLAAAGGDQLPIIPSGWRAMGFDVLARAHVQLGRLEDAARYAEQADAVAAAVGLPMARAWAQRAAAAVALDGGDATTAAERALASATAAEEAGVVIDAALSRTLAGRALAALGEKEGAAAELERAAGEFDARGALRYRDAAERELRKLGKHISRPTSRGRADATGLESLSERELQVARLVVDRKTNREIAAELFLSLKTVETHMRNLFRKLGVSSRVEVARAVERAESAP